MMARAPKKMALTKLWPAALACLMLAGCGTAAGLSNKVIAGISPTTSVTPVRIKKDTPIIDIALRAQGISGPLARTALRGDVSEWRSADGVGLTLRGGQIIATRGFGADLLIADAAGAEAALRHGRGTYSRTMHWLDGENHDQVEAFACSLDLAPSQPVASERVLSEICTGPKTRTENTYALSRATGKLLRLDQWVSPGLGHITVNLR
jgi:hypothetical protein